MGARGLVLGELDISDAEVLMAGENDQPAIDLGLSTAGDTAQLLTVEAPEDFLIRAIQFYAAVAPGSGQPQSQEDSSFQLTTQNEIQPLNGRGVYVTERMNAQTDVNDTTNGVGASGVAPESEVWLTPSGITDDAAHRLAGGQTIQVFVRLHSGVRDPTTFITQVVVYGVEEGSGALR